LQKNWIRFLFDQMFGWWSILLRNLWKFLWKLLRFDCGWVKHWEKVLNKFVVGHFIAIFYNSNIFWSDTVRKMMRKLPGKWINPKIIIQLIIFLDCNLLKIIFKSENLFLNEFLIKENSYFFRQIFFLLFLYLDFLWEILLIYDFECRIFQEFLFLGIFLFFDRGI
jgi:hypothetical protein